MSQARDIVPARRETLLAPSLDDRVGRFTLRQLSVVQWIGVVVAPLAWTAQHVVGYGVGEARCNVGGLRWGIGYDTWQLAILAVAGLFIVVSEAAAVAVFLATRETNYGDGPPGDGRRLRPGSPAPACASMKCPPHRVRSLSGNLPARSATPQES